MQLAYYWTFHTLPLDGMSWIALSSLFILEFLYLRYFYNTTYSFCHLPFCTILVLVTGLEILLRGCFLPTKQLLGKNTYIPYYAKCLNAHHYLYPVFDMQTVLSFFLNPQLTLTPRIFFIHMFQVKKNCFHIETAGFSQIEVWFFFSINAFFCILGLWADFSSSVPPVPTPRGIYWVCLVRFGLWQGKRTLLMQ